MPHMSGKELSERVRALYPHTRILFTSAYTENAIRPSRRAGQGVGAPAKTLHALTRWRTNCGKCWINRTLQS